MSGEGGGIAPGHGEGGGRNIKTGDLGGSFISERDANAARATADVDDFSSGGG